MRDKFTELFDTLETALTSTKRDLVSALNSLPSPRKLPLPITTWLFFVLVRYRERQEWARSLIGEKLPHACPPSAKLCRKDQPVYLAVPGMPDWHLQLEACYDDGFLAGDFPPETIRVDVSAEGQRGFIMFGDLQSSIRCNSRWSPEWIWRQQFEWRHRQLDTDDRVPLREIRQAGLIENVHFDDDDFLEEMAWDMFRITDKAWPYRRIVDRYCEAMKVAKNRVLLAAATGDWMLADAAALHVADRETRSLIFSRMRECSSWNNSSEYKTVAVEEYEE